jgi:hypothetical protein
MTYFHACLHYQIFMETRVIRLDNTIMVEPEYEVGGLTDQEACQVHLSYTQCEELPIDPETGMEDLNAEPRRRGTHFDLKCSDDRSRDREGDTSSSSSSDSSSSDSSDDGDEDTGSATRRAARRARRRQIKSTLRQENDLLNRATAAATPLLGRVGRRLTSFEYLQQQTGITDRLFSPFVDGDSELGKEERELFEEQLLRMPLGHPDSQDYMANIKKFTAAWNNRVHEEAVKKLRGETSLHISSKLQIHIKAWHEKVRARITAATGLSDDSMAQQRLTFRQVMQANERTNIGAPQQLLETRAEPNARQEAAPPSRAELSIAAPSQASLVVIPVQPSGAPGPQQLALLYPHAPRPPHLPIVGWSETARPQLVPQQAPTEATRRGHGGVCRGCLGPLTGHRRGFAHAKCPNNTRGYTQPPNKKGDSHRAQGVGGGGK